MWFWKKVLCSSQQKTWKDMFIFECLYLFVSKKLCGVFYVTLCCKYFVVKSCNHTCLVVLVLNKVALPHRYSHDTTSLHLFLPLCFPPLTSLSFLLPSASSADEHENRFLIILMEFDLVWNGFELWCMIEKVWRYCTFSLQISPSLSFLPSYPYIN